MKKLTVIGIVFTFLIGLAQWQQQLFVAKAAPVFNTITVTNPDDSGAGSLRQAITDAVNGDTINFDTAGVFATPQTITLTTWLDLNKSLTIQGPGASQLTVSGNNATRVFFLWGTTVTLDGLTISGGKTAADGGGIFNQFGVLTLTNCTVSGNVVTAGSGGAIYNSGALTLTNSTVSGNSSNGISSGGGIVNDGGWLTLNNSTVSGNVAGGNGGGISNLSTGTLTLTNSTVSGNSANGYGGGISNLSTGTGSLTLTNSL